MLEFGCPFCDWDEEAESPEQASEITGDHMRWKHIGPIDFGDVPASAAGLQLLIAGMIGPGELERLIQHDVELAAGRPAALAAVLRNRWTAILLVFAVLYGVLVGLMLAAGTWTPIAIFLGIQLSLISYMTWRKRKIVTPPAVDLSVPDHLPSNIAAADEPISE